MTVEIRVPTLQEIAAQSQSPSLDSSVRNRRFTPPTMHDISRSVINFQQSLYDTFTFDYCDCCDEKVSPASKLLRISTTNPIIDVLLESHATSATPSIFCPVRNAKLHVHRIRFANMDLEPQLFLCEFCNNDLLQNTVPLFSIKNAVYVESVPPQLLDLSLAELLTISKVYKRSVIWQSGSQTVGQMHSVLNHHILCFENDVQNYTTILPRPISELTSLLKIIFLSDTEEEQQLPKVGCIRKEKVLGALEWLKTNNPLYADITIDGTMLNISEVHIQIESAATEEDLDRLIPGHASFTKSREHYEVELDNGTTIERNYSSGLYQVQSRVDDERNFKIRGAINNWLRHGPDGLIAQFHDSDMLSVFGDLNWIPMSYPDLFPLGKTGLAVDRPRPISFEDWVSHLLKISDPRFREHYDFPLFMFNLSQRRKVSKSCK